MNIATLIHNGFKLPLFATAINGHIVKEQCAGVPSCAQRRGALKSAIDIGIGATGIGGDPTLANLSDNLHTFRLHYAYK